MYFNADIQTPWICMMFPQNIYIFDSLAAVFPQRSCTLMVPPGLHKIDQPVTKNSLIVGLVQNSACWYSDRI